MTKKKSQEEEFFPSNIRVEYSDEPRRILPNGQESTRAAPVLADLFVARPDRDMIDRATAFVSRMVGQKVIPERVNVKIEYEGLTIDETRRF